MTTKFSKTFSSYQVHQVDEWRVNPFPDEGDRNGSWNVGLLSFQLLDVTSSPRKFNESCF